MKILNLKSVLHILGFLIMILGMMMVLPLSLSYLFDDGTHMGILYSMLITISSGLLMFKLTSTKTDLSIRDGFLIVSLGWFFMALFGAFPYYLSDSIPTFTNSFFESMSGFTTTGATILTDIEALPKSLHFWRAFTHWIGGMGIIVLSLAILPMLGIGGMQLFKAEVPGPTADKLTPRVHQTAKILWLVYVGITALEVILLMFGDMDLFDAVCHSFATMATGGFSTRNLSVGAYNSAYIDYVITIFMFIAGANFALHYKLLIGKFNSHLADFEFKTYFSVIIVVTIIITITNFSGEIYSTLSDSFQYGVFQTVAIITTTGFGTADYELWSPSSQLLIFLMMFVGGSAGSTGGGMKIIRLIVVVKHGFIELKKLVHPNAIIPLRIGSRVIQKEVVFSIIGFFLLYIMLFVIVSIIMSLLGLDYITSLGASASCLGNIGPGLGMVGPTDNYSFIPDIGKWVLAFTMLVGRLEIYTVLVILTTSFWRK